VIHRDQRKLEAYRAQENWVFRHGIGVSCMGVQIRPTPRMAIKMSDKSKIEWTEATWNPLRGCVKISPGCKHCYAETFAERFRGVPNHPYEQGFDLRLVPAKLLEPLSWPAPRMVFANSMSDLFQDGVPDDYIVAAARVMEAAKWHTFQVLTKRADRMRTLLNTTLGFASKLPNVWWGVSVENVRYGVPRIGHLQEAAARVRFLSVEPLLEDVGRLELSGLHWVIVGGESGPGARPMREDWVHNVRIQCEEASIPFFFKQWGGVQKGKTGRLLNGRTYDGMPARSDARMPERGQRKRMAEVLDGEYVRQFRDAGVVPTIRLVRQNRRAALA
jgi:protein gp37